MSILEQKLDALMQLMTAETTASLMDAKDRIRKLLEDQNRPGEIDADLNSEIRRLLLEIGIPDHLLGHGRLVTAIALVVEKPDLLGAITCELYPEVGKIHNTTKHRVERAIRHAIEVAWDRGDLDVLMDLFGNTISRSKGKPTNSEFIARAANIIRERLAK